MSRPRACASAGIICQTSVLQRVPPHSIAELANPRLAGCFASGAGWLVAIVWVAASAITMGPHNDTPQSLPFSCSQSTAASLKYPAARCGSTCATAAGAQQSNTAAHCEPVFFHPWGDHVMPP